MKIGRFSTGIIQGGYDFGYEKYICECRILSIGIFYLMWSGIDCRCTNCGLHFCVCSCELCDKLWFECDCEKFK